MGGPVKHFIFVVVCSGLFFSLVLLVVTYAEEGESIFYVQSVKAPVYTEPIIQEQPYFQLVRGHLVKVQSIQGSWMYIEDGNGRDGWIYSLLLSASLPNEGWGHFEDDVVITKAQRVRASLYGNSAASRGLLPSSNFSVLLMSNLKHRRFDFDSVTRMEQFSVSLSDGLLFMNQRSSR